MITPRFQLAPGVTLEQQMFLPNDGSGAAFSWQILGGVVPARLTVRAFLSGCGPRSYRDAGFQHEPEKNGGRLIWLPSVRGPSTSSPTVSLGCLFVMRLRPGDNLYFALLRRP
jgi:hypothetical protein